MTSTATGDVFVVVGLLSMGYDNFVRCCPRRGSGARAAQRRDRIREVSAPYLQALNGRLALRFIVAGLVPPEAKPNDRRSAALQLEPQTLVADHVFDELVPPASHPPVAHEALER